MPRIARRHINAAAAAAGAALVAALLLSGYALREQAAATAWVSHTRDVLEASEQAVSLYKDVPLATRLYLLVREPSIAARADAAERPALAAVDKLSGLTLDNPVQRERVERLRRGVQKGLDFNRALRRRPGGAMPARDGRAADARTSAVRASADALIVGERALLADRTRRQRRSARMTRAMLTALLALTLLAFLLAMWALKRDIGRVALAETRLEQANASLGRQKDELQRSNEELERFAYVASHDLKEPLRMVVSYTQLLQRRYQGKLDADADAFIAFAVDGATRMRDLIDGLLEYSRVSRGDDPVEAVDAEQALLRALVDAEDAVARAGARVEHASLPVVLACRGQLHRVFQNLIANGVKFQPAGRPAVVRIGARRDGDWWVFSVADNGIGIPPEHLGEIFALFKRLHRQREYPGTGLGLAICKRIVECGGGRIWVESEPDKGSTFFFTARAADGPPA